MVARLWHGRQEANIFQYAIQSLRSGWEAEALRDLYIEIREVDDRRSRCLVCPLALNSDQALAISVRLKSSPVKSSGMPATDATAYAIQSPKFKAAG